MNKQGNLAFSADGDGRLLGLGIGRDIALGDGHTVIGKESLDFMQYGQPVITYSVSS